MGPTLLGLQVLVAPTSPSVYYRCVTSKRIRRPTDPVTSRALTQRAPVLSIPEQIKLFKETIDLIERVQAACPVAVIELGRVMAQNKQTIKDLRQVIANLEALGDSGE